LYGPDFAAGKNGNWREHSLIRSVLALRLAVTAAPVVQTIALVALRIGWARAWMKSTGGGAPLADICRPIKGRQGAAAVKLPLEQPLRRRVAVAGRPGRLLWRRTPTNRLWCTGSAWMPSVIYAP
jgi:hypothetical protein